jgi:hypothetical protein
MTDFLRILDPYARQARLYPALLALLPTALVFLARVPNDLAIWQYLGSVAFACGLLFGLADWARSCGKRIEPRLLKLWGGWPTTIWLRHRDNHLSQDVKRRYHEFFSRQAALGAMPTVEDEKRDPARADQKYDSVVFWLREQCRGPNFPLVEKENATYGFRRNLFGLKTTAISMLTLTLAIPAIVGVAMSRGSAISPLQAALSSYTSAPSALAATLAFTAAALAVWIVAVNAGWVRAAGDQYASALLAGCDKLSSQK